MVVHKRDNVVRDNSLLTTDLIPISLHLLGDLSIQSLDIECRGLVDLTVRLVHCCGSDAHAP